MVSAVAVVGRLAVLARIELRAARCVAAVRAVVSAAAKLRARVCASSELAGCAVTRSGCPAVRSFEDTDAAPAANPRQHPRQDSRLDADSTPTRQPTRPTTQLPAQTIQLAAPTIRLLNHAGCSAGGRDGRRGTRHEEDEDKGRQGRDKGRGQGTTRNKDEGQGQGRGQGRGRGRRSDTASWQAAGVSARALTRQYPHGPASSDGLAVDGPDDSSGSDNIDGANGGADGGRAASRQSGARRQYGAATGTSPSGAVPRGTLAAAGQPVGHIPGRSPLSPPLIEEPACTLRADDHERYFKLLEHEQPDLEASGQFHFTWTIESYRDLPDRKIRSPTHLLNGQPWQILFFPFGNGNCDQVSVYLEAGKPEDADSDWYACAQFYLVMWNPEHPDYMVHNSAHHRFNDSELDWGFTRFYDLKHLFVKERIDGHPVIEDDRVNITAYVRMISDPTGVLWHNFVDYDSKQCTGYVGFKNQGATCYMNSLLQSLYFTNVFRKAVFQIPTENDVPHNSVPLALQRIFVNLQHSSLPVSTSELTRSFGWDTMDSFMQHDVQEFNRVLQDHLERKMKGTSVDGILTKLFVGKMKSYIKCVNVDYESSRSEDFWDIQLNVKGMRDLRESFRDYVSEEIMDGDNKYFAEGYGLQEAKKGVTFQYFPPVLHLQLKRFEYDYQRDVMVKINDRHEYPLEIDLQEFVDQKGEQNKSWRYHLHGVLVHSGDLHGGHYYGLLQPEKGGPWYRFDDDRVTKATLKEVLDENFGGELTPRESLHGVKNPYTRTVSMKRYMSAYMLVYIADDSIDEVLSPVTETDTPVHIVKKMEQDRLASLKRQQESMERHLYMNIHVVTYDNFRQHTGFDLFPLDKDGGAYTGESPIRSFNVLKDTKINEFQSLVADASGQKANHIRFWVMVNRQNRTIRPDAPVTESDDYTMEQIRERMSSKTGDLMLWMETADELCQSLDKDQETVQSPTSLENEKMNGCNDTQLSETVNWPPYGLNGSQILIFLKYYDMERQKIRGITSLYVHRFDKIGDLVTVVKRIMSWPDSTEIAFFEEIKPTMIESLKPNLSFQASEIQDGDIITFERVLSENELIEATNEGKYVTATQCYSTLLNKVHVVSKPLKPRFISSGVTFRNAANE